jgi:enterochelin esterase family protein
VIIDLYIPVDLSENTSLLLINDGQDLEEMHYGLMVDQLSGSHHIHSVLSVGIHAGRDRKNEYGTARIRDFAGRGSKAEAYNRFILEELIPFLHMEFGIEKFAQTGFAGFSLGGLTALDMVWNHPGVFSFAGVFSGALWWRTKSLEDDYVEERDRIMHQQIRTGKYTPGLRFYFTTGSQDESADRNNNGIIDSIDDTIALIDELKAKGYNTDYDIHYINFDDGKHDVATWGRAMPGFLLWGCGR